MKISPVVGIPTIPNLQSTGLSSEKLAAIKAMAAGQPAPEPEKETIQLGETPISGTQRIQMNTNRTVLRNGEPQELQENAPPLNQEPPAPVEPTLAIPDPSVQTKPVAEATRPVSPELAQLAKDRRALQIEREQLAKEKEALKGQTAEALIKKLQTSPLSVLQEHGVTYEQLTNEILGQQQQPDLTKFEENILKKIDERLAGKDTQQEESVYNFMKQNVDKMSFSSDKYKLIRESKSQGDVMELVKRTWNEKGEILDETEAMDLIEAELREDARRYAKSLGYIDPTQTAVEEPKAPSVPQAPKQGIKTLTNKDSARPVMDRKKRAMAAFLGQK